MPVDYRCRTCKSTFCGGAIGNDNHIVQNIFRIFESYCHALTEYRIIVNADQYPIVKRSLWWAGVSSSSTIALA